MKYTEEEILQHYKTEADRHGLNGACTIQDIRTRILEMRAILSYLHDGIKVLEVGCGNGFVAQKIVEELDIDIDAIDFSPEMIAIAKSRIMDSARGRVNYAHQDILTFKKNDEYDLVFTERCLQNLTSWDDQKIALLNIVNSLKPKGQLILLESFDTGHNNLNAARMELELPVIDPSWHNLFFNEKDTVEYLRSINCHFKDQNPFLSGYYFSSRLILPSIMPKNKPVTSKSVLNDYFCHMPAWGDFCPIKIMRFIKF